MDAYDANLCELEIKRTYGDRVSIENKAKTLRKFGRTDNADAGVKTTVATSNTNNTSVSGHISGYLAELRG